MYPIWDIFSRSRWSARVSYLSAHTVCRSMRTCYCRHSRKYFLLCTDWVHISTRLLQRTTAMRRTDGYPAIICCERLLIFAMIAIRRIINSRSRTRVIRSATTGTYTEDLGSDREFAPTDLRILDEGSILDGSSKAAARGRWSVLRENIPSFVEPI